MSDNNKLIEKIKKLLARAKDQSDTPEGELAASIAANIMREHAISLSQVEEQTEVEEVLHLHQDEHVTQVWWSLLYAAVGSYCDVQIAYATARSGRYITFVGYSHNIEITKFLFDSIKGQMEREFKAHCKERKKFCEEYGYNYKYNRPSPKAFYVSAYRVVKSKLESMKYEQQRQDRQDAMSNESVARGNALVLKRKNEVAAKVATLGWKTGSAYSAGHSSAGAAAGGRVKIQSGINGQRKLNG
jgi:SHS2 domain-containing protein